MSDSFASGKLEIVTCIPADSPLKASIKAVLQQGENLTLSSGGDFTGRVATRLIRGEGLILKLREEMTGNIEVLNSNIGELAQREKLLGIYPPDKTWFVIRQDDSYLAGNICQELMPINQLVDNKAYGSLAELQEIFNAIYGMSIRILAEQQFHLDISLSNYGISKDTDTVFYLDDDVYKGDADDFTILSESFSTIIRNNDELPQELWFTLGEAVRELTDKYFGSNYVGRISYAIGEPPMIRPEGIECRNNLLKGFVRKKVPKRTSKTESQEKITQAKNITHNIGPKEGPAKIALLSDIHANVSALDAVLKELEKYNIIKIIITGDIVGYGPDPAECIERLRDLPNTRIIKGNHDHGAGTLTKEELIDNFNGVPREVLLWTQDIISQEQKQWLTDLPREIKTDDWWAVHGSPKDPHKFYGYVYVMTYNDNLDTIQNLGVKRCFHGHTHVQGIYLRKGKQDLHIEDESVSLGENDYALINPGSVGQPRGGKPGAEFALISEDLADIDFYRTEYETDGLLQRMHEANFPKTLGDRILKGR